ncbi:dephospho-CoA kinase-like protein [Trachipleistophora hominis]|uniref:Dephospho-CoA kinase-like protein n=1 Tax=Trachipleistophora hominis TaxID=72359 RepID=L7K0E4_TRAHO|nr:dephospho-CoA kinase-like protein [Trachipleistophora hominis]
MYIVGITGNIGTGKSLVGSLLRQKGYCVVDADKISREVLEHNKELLRRNFPELFVNNQFSKAKLKEIIFKKEKNKKAIERILHYKITVKMCYIVLMEALKFKRVVFLEIPLFFEYNLDRFFDSIVVYCDKSTQAERITGRDGNSLLNEKLKAQKTMEEKKKRGTFLIDNGGSVEYTKMQINNLKFSGYTIYFYFTVAVLTCYLAKYLLKNLLK